jgi:hypothetical protein
MKPTSTLDIIFTVLKLIQLTFELIKKKEKKVEKDVPLTNPFRDDHTSVLNDFLGRDKNK